MTLDVANRICRTVGFTLVNPNGEFNVTPIGSHIADAPTSCTDILNDRA